ncbi:hypothetical protein HYPSUDRAFT_84327 [Hypholoma sublateritium FD-334 SS-4]|uniref:Uncharacterized protein n=1 Tax=Hypholoma sublateritium (strain FD-334 SS-4) TaxID=945553 RepID=A0A0D2P7I6_HYPSF|nr:hypothetical protein HYPSUDRAFT_84327 [Hypholoma sublateritium FD-334 SS-4]
MYSLKQYKPVLHNPRICIHGLQVARADNRACHNRLIGKYPTGKLSPFSTYVSLSSLGRDAIRLLRDFDEDLFQHHPSEYLRKDISYGETRATEQKNKRRI